MQPVNFALIVQALNGVGLLVEQRGSLPDLVRGITDDSRAVVSDGIFVAVRGTDRDGHDYLDKAAEQGAAVAILEDPSRSTLPALIVRDGRRAAAIAAAAFYGDPANEMTLVAVTGTNGKTTTVNILRHLLDDRAARSASIGTLGVLIGSEGAPLPGGGGLTTPGPVELQRVLRALVGNGVTCVAMETSSHALHQRRVEGLRFRVAVFTNLTQDHLDYHGTMQEYFEAKALLIRHVASDGTVVVNMDDDAWGALTTDKPVVTYGVERAADVRAAHPRYSPRGSEFELKAREKSAIVSLPLIGDFNVSNAAAASAAALSLGMDPGVVGNRLNSVPQIPGRLEIVHEQPTVLRDYAHTPDALERAIAAVRPFASKRLIVLFGCGGDRDKGKRPLMGRIAETGADLAVLTSDNPRTEDPEAILDDVEAGMSKRDHRRIADRREAIAFALHEANSDDVVLLAGKGHETYQIRGTTSYPFDESQIVRELTAGQSGRIQ